MYKPAQNVLWLIVIFIFLALCSVTTAAEQNQQNMTMTKQRYAAATQRDYEDVLEDVEFAISEHNYRRTGGNHIGSAIGQRENIPFPKSDIIHFCNLEFARQFLQIDPEFLIHMPCKVVVYERGEDVVVETELLPEDDERLRELTQQVNQILRDIVDYATEE